MKVVHIGNVANIAYLNTKFLRRKGVNADVYVYDYGITCLSCPEWEEGDFDAHAVSMKNPDWSKVSMKNGWKRPDWAKSVPPLTWHRLPYSHDDPFIERMESNLNVRLSYKKYRIVVESLKRRGLPALSFEEIARHFDIYRWERMVADYDIVVAYGVEPINCLVDYPAKPYIAVDYGTPLRDMIAQGKNSVYNLQLLRWSYTMADYVILTNPDVRDIADQLGLRNYIFIPHPVDETRYAPGPSQVRAELESRFGKDVVVVFAPARHDWSIKGNDKMIQAFSRLVKEHSAPLVLILNSWGQEVERSKELLRCEGLEDKVIWLPLISKFQMVEYYRAADIVLDQFNIGSFGLTTPEAMACGKPVVLHFDPKVHAWCFTEMPPVLQAQTPEEIYEQVRRLIIDPELRWQIGGKSREWVIQHHGWEKVANLHIELYRKILKKKKFRFP
jgi:glycosyltransferase involved in cell wall biosynthesis